MKIPSFCCSEDSVSFVLKSVPDLEFVEAIALRLCDKSPVRLPTFGLTQAASTIAGDHTTEQSRSARTEPTAVPSMQIRLLFTMQKTYRTCMKPRKRRYSSTILSAQLIAPRREDVAMPMNNNEEQLLVTKLPEFLTKIEK